MNGMGQNIDGILKNLCIQRPSRVTQVAVTLLPASASETCTQPEKVLDQCRGRKTRQWPNGRNRWNRVPSLWRLTEYTLHHKWERYELQGVGFY